MGWAMFVWAASTSSGVVAEATAWIEPREVFQHRLGGGHVQFGQLFKASESGGGQGGQVSGGVFASGGEGLGVEFFA